MCSSSISYKYPWTIGAAYPTTVPHSQSHAAGSPAHLDPACQSHSTYPALCHGVSPGGTMGGLGRQHSCWGDRVACPRPHPGKTHDVDCSVYMQYYTRTYICQFQAKEMEGWTHWSFYRVDIKHHLKHRQKLLWFKFKIQPQLGRSVKH